MRSFFNNTLKNSWVFDKSGLSFGYLTYVDNSVNGENDGYWFYCYDPYGNYYNRSMYDMCIELYDTAIEINDQFLCTCRKAGAF